MWCELKHGLVENVKDLYNGWRMVGRLDPLFVPKRVQGSGHKRGRRVGENETDSTMHTISGQGPGACCASVRPARCAQ